MRFVGVVRVNNGLDIHNKAAETIAEKPAAHEVPPNAAARRALMSDCIGNNAPPAKANNNARYVPMILQPGPSECNVRQRGPVLISIAMGDRIQMMVTKYAGERHRHMHTFPSGQCQKNIF